MASTYQALIQEMMLPGPNGRKMQWGSNILVAGTSFIPTRLQYLHNIQIQPVGATVTGTVNLYVNETLNGDGYFVPGTVMGVRVNSDLTSAASTAQYYFQFIGF